MDICIKSLTGKSYSLTVQEDESIRGVKAKVAQLHDTPALQHRLLHKGRTLADTTRVRELELQDGDFLVLMSFVSKKKSLAGTAPLPPVDEVGMGSFQASVGAGEAQGTSRYEKELARVARIKGQASKGLSGVAASRMGATEASRGQVSAPDAAGQRSSEGANSDHRRSIKEGLSAASAGQAVGVVQSKTQSSLKVSDHLAVERRQAGPEETVAGPGVREKSDGQDHCRDGVKERDSAQNEQASGDSEARVAGASESGVGSTVDSARPTRKGGRTRAAAKKASDAPAEQGEGSVQQVPSEEPGGGRKKRRKSISQDALQAVPDEGTPGKHQPADKEPARQPRARKRKAPAQPSEVPETEAAGSSRATAARSKAAKAALLERLPLPPEALTLERAFGALNTIHGFLQRQYVQATWHNTRAAMNQILATEEVAAVDVERMAQICPQVVVLRPFTESGTATPSFMIDLIDPSQREPLAPVMPPTPSTESEPWAIMPGAKYRKPTDRQVASVMERRKRLFREALVEAVAVLHSQWLKERGIEAAAPSGPEGSLLDQLTDDSWHPDFCLKGITMDQLLAAAKTSQAHSKANAPKEKPAPPKSPGGGQRKKLSKGGEATGPPRPPQALKKVPKCTLTTQLSAPEMLEHLREGLGSLGQIVHCERYAQREAKYEAPARALSSAVAALLAARGLAPERLFTHQAKAIGAAVAGRHVVVATSTASGKSLCYNIPVLEALLGPPPSQSIPSGGMEATVERVSPREAVLPEGLPGGFCWQPTDPPGDAEPSEGGSYQAPPMEEEPPSPGGEEVLITGGATALYLFPTKALAQDQLRAMEEFMAPLKRPPRVAVYDGDTPQEERAELRAKAQVMITNPDMLHISMLPCHRQFATFLHSLRYVVVDEGHAYRGVFGCHVALILRRLRRVCSQIYGSHPTFIVCSATVANPKEHAQELTGLQDWEEVTQDGSPRGDKTFVLWNPPLSPVQPMLARKRGKKGDQEVVRVRNGRVMPTAEPSFAERFRLKEMAKAAQEAGVALPESVIAGDPRGACGGVGGGLSEKRRNSPIVEVAFLLAEMVQHGMRCLAFCKTRKLCELVLTYARETLKTTAPELADSIRSYRAGYTAADRRAIEGDLFAGRLLGVAATNALELGVDVGSLDVTLHLGFPGTVASLWQQAGRAGRRINGRGSLSIYVAFGGPLDQWFMRDPKRLFGRAIEHAQVDASNWKVLTAHLACAAVENPLRLSVDDQYFGAAFEEAVKELAVKGQLGRNPLLPSEAWLYIGEEKAPAKVMSIRAIDQEKYTVVDEASGEVIEEVEASKAFFEVYEGAVYMHQGRTFLCKHLDLTTKIATCRQASLKYYTKTQDYTEVSVIGGKLAYPGKAPDPKRWKPTSAQCGPAQVTTRWLGFRRIWQGTGQVFDMVDLFLPEVSYKTHAAWVRVPHALRGVLAAEGLGFREGLHAAGHALLNVLPLYIMCNPNDIGTVCDSPHDTRYRPERLLVFDRQPDGIGIAVQARPMFAELLQAALELLEACDCTSSTGCPACVQHTGCGEYNEVIDKQAAIIVLKGVIAAEEAHKMDEQEHQE